MDFLFPDLGSEDIILPTCMRRETKHHLQVTVSPKQHSVEWKTPSCSHLSERKQRRSLERKTMLCATGALFVGADGWNACFWVHFKQAICTHGVTHLVAAFTPVHTLNPTKTRSDGIWTWDPQGGHQLLINEGSRTDLNQYGQCPLPFGERSHEDSSTTQRNVASTQYWSSTSNFRCCKPVSDTLLHKT